MKTHVIRGSKQEIADTLVRLKGDVREAIIFEEESVPSGVGACTEDTEDIFSEMRPFMVDSAGVDDSREAIYTRSEGE